MQIVNESAISESKRSRSENPSERLRIPVRSLWRGEAYFSDSADQVLKEANPEVRATEVSIFDSESRKVVARYRIYSRVGGDFPGYGHPTSFVCPEASRIRVELGRIFS